MKQQLRFKRVKVAMAALAFAVKNIFPKVALTEVTGVMVVVYFLKRLKA